MIGVVAGGNKGALMGGLLGAGAGTSVAAGTGRQAASFPVVSVYVRTDISNTTAAPLNCLDRQRR